MTPKNSPAEGREAGRRPGQGFRHPQARRGRKVFMALVEQVGDA